MHYNEDRKNSSATEANLEMIIRKLFIRQTRRQKQNYYCEIRDDVNRIHNEYKLKKLQLFCVESFCEIRSKRLIIVNTESKQLLLIDTDELRRRGSIRGFKTMTDSYEGATIKFLCEVVKTRYEKVYKKKPSNFEIINEKEYSKFEVDKFIRPNETREIFILTLLLRRMEEMESDSSKIIEEVLDYEVGEEEARLTRRWIQQLVERKINVSSTERDKMKKMNDPYFRLFGESPTESQCMRPEIENYLQINSKIIFRDQKLENDIQQLGIKLPALRGGVKFDGNKLNLIQYNITLQTSEERLVKTTEIREKILVKKIREIQSELQELKKHNVKNVEKLVSLTEKASNLSKGNNKKLEREVIDLKFQYERQIAELNAKALLVSAKHYLEKSELKKKNEELEALQSKEETGRREVTSGPSSGAAIVKRRVLNQVRRKHLWYALSHPYIPTSATRRR